MKKKEEIYDEEDGEREKCGSLTSSPTYSSSQNWTNPPRPPTDLSIPLCLSLQQFHKQAVGKGERKSSFFLDFLMRGHG